MSRLPVLVIFAALFLIAVPPRTEARLIENWPYEKLMKEADLVVIARAVKTVDTKDTLPNNPWHAPFVGQDTTLDVAVALKGNPARKSITVLHYKLGVRKTEAGTAPVLIEDGPLLVAFRSKGITTISPSRKSYTPAPEYLLFLKARKDGRYEPLSGQIDPALSVRAVTAPDEDYMPDDEAEKKSVRKP